MFVALVAVVTVLATVAGASTSAAAVKYSDLGKPELATTVQGSNVLEAGETTRLTFGVQNTGTDVTNQDGSIDKLSQVLGAHTVRPGAAVSTRATVQANDAPVTVKTDTQSVGTLGTGDMRAFPVTVEVNENAEPGTYRLPVTFTYQYVQAVSVDREDYFVTRNEETVTKYVTVRVEPSVRLGVVSTSGQGLYENADGRVEVTVRNEGTETATNAELMVVGGDSLTPRTNGASLGTVGPGETATASFRVGVGDVESPGDYGIQFQLRYEDQNGVVSKTAVRTGDVRVGTGPEFDIAASAQSLYVDSEGAVTLEVTNTGDVPATDARVTLGETEPFVPLTSSASLGTLEPGESAEVRFKLEIANRALPGEYPLRVTVSHDDRYGEPVDSDVRTVPVTVGPEMTVETGGEPAIAAGATDQIQFTVTNTGEGTMRDAVVRINTNSPFETDDDTAYVGTLAPGESKTVTFTVSVDGAATAKPYAIDTTVKYDNAFDRRVVTDIESTSVQVTEGGGGLLGALLDVIGL